MGVAGVTNWPTVGFLNGRIREAFEEDGIGLAAEVELLRRAREQGLATFAFVLNAADIRAFGELGVDAYIMNAGLTPLQFALDDRRDRLQDSIAHINRMIEAIGTSASRLLCLYYGGPFTDIEDFAKLFHNANVDGIAGGSVFERLPVQAIISNFVRRCKSLSLADDNAQEPERREMVWTCNGFAPVT